MGEMEGGKDYYEDRVVLYCKYGVQLRRNKGGGRKGID